MWRRKQPIAWHLPTEVAQRSNHTAMCSLHPPAHPPQNCSTGHGITAGTGYWVSVKGIGALSATPEESRAMKTTV
jgi:hypothetical protein